MPLVMLKRDWPGKFRRTIGEGKKTQVLEFLPGVAVDLTAKQIDGIKGDLGRALMPATRDGRKKVRVITDDVAPDAEAEGDSNGSDAG